MDKKQFENIVEPSVMQRANEINEIQKQIDPLHQIRNSLNILEIVKQNAGISSAANIGEIARKAFQQSGLDSANFKNQSAIARFAQSRAEEAVTFQDTFLEARKGLSAHNNILSIKEKMIQSMGGASVYGDILASVDSFRKSLEPLRSSLSTAHSVFETSEISRLVRDIQEQKAITNSVLSDYAGVFKQVESLHSLESFKAIARLKNFPFENMVPIDLDSISDLEENVSETIVELDSEISDELSLVSDFNELSEERRTILLDLYQTYYYPIILNCLVILMGLQVFLDERLDFTNNIFIFVDSTKGTLSYIGNNIYQPDPSAIIDGIVGGALLMLFVKIFGNEK